MQIRTEHVHVTLIQHEDDADHGPTFATVCDGHTGVAAGYVLAQLKLGVQLFDGDCFYYQGAKIMHSAGTPLDMPAKANGPVRAYVVAQTAAALVKEAAKLSIEEIKTWKQSGRKEKKERNKRNKMKKRQKITDQETQALEDKQ
jgi:serine/threonine protein phosphatase PrpC